MRSRIRWIAACLIAVAAGVGVMVTSQTAHTEPVCVVIPGTAPGEQVCIQLTPETASNPVGTEHTVLAEVIVINTLSPDLDPVGFMGAELFIGVIEGPNKGLTHFGTADVNGEVDFSYIGAGGPGTDTILTCLFIPELEGCHPDVFNVATKEWTESTGTPTPIPSPTPTPPPECHAVPDGEALEGVWCITLEPESATRTVGTEHTFVATVTRDGEPHQSGVVGIEVIDGPNVPSVAAGITDKDGQLPSGYTGAGGPGTDTIRACIATTDPPGCQNFGTDAEPIEVNDTATVVWTPAAALAAEDVPVPAPATGGAARAAAGPASGAGSLSPAASSIPVWAAIASGLGAAGLLVATRTAPRKRRKS